MASRSLQRMVERLASRRFIKPKPLRKHEKLYEFKVVLRNTRPAVERRIVIASDDNLQQLGRVAIRAVGMVACKFDLRGPDDEHIRGYNPNNPFDTDTDSDSDSDSDSTKMEKRSSITIKIAEFFDLPERNKIVLEYGRHGWRFVITLMKIRERALQLYPQCISGKGACPPEDVNGPEDYKEILKRIKNRSHNEHNDAKDWLTSIGYKNFDPNMFKASSVVFNW